MHLSFTTLVLATLTSFTAALPRPQNNNLITPKDTCTHTPASPTPPRLNLVNRPDLSIVTTQTVSFTLPAPASSLQGPCTLRAVFPPHWEIVDTSLQAGGAPLAVDVYAADGPAAGALVGTARFADAGRHEWEERVVAVNSFACRERMAFRFELAAESVGEIGFVNGFDQGLGVTGGLEVTYGC